MACLPTSALAEVCDKIRPGWDGAAVTPLGEALFMFQTGPSLLLLVATAIALRFRSAWGGLVVVLLWTLLVSVLAMGDPFGFDGQAQAEGCIGSPALFIGLVAAICVGTVLYTMPRNTGD